VKTSVFLGLLLIASSVTASAQGSGEAVSASPRTVWDAVYSTEQAVRGEDAYTNHCANCHREDLAGYNGLLRGSRFMEKFREASLHLLFDKTKTTMPRNAAGTLSDQAYLDIVSYVLQENEFPAGSSELRIDDLTRVRLVGKGGAEPVPDFSLVQVIGCFGKRENVWMLTGATEPVRTGRPQPEPEEIKSLKSDAAGSSTFHLMVSLSYAPDDHIGRLVEVRGFLIRRPDVSRVNITSLQPIGPACVP
jgi:mono/diheme cytochrome c family protein